MSKRNRLGGGVSVATRLALVALAVTLLSLTVTGVVGLRQGSQLADDVIRDRLASISASRADQVERNMRHLANQVAALALSPSTAVTLSGFAEAFDELDRDPASSQSTRRVTDHYRGVVAPALESVRGVPVDAAALSPTGNAATRLQAAYVVPATTDAPAPVVIDDAGDGSSWTALHASVHPGLRSVSQRAGFDDLYLVSARSDTVVYSVEKGIDFTSSLDVGPFSGTTLSTVVRLAGESADPANATWVDYAQFAGAGDRPVAFVASPVMDGDRVEGVVVARVDTSVPNAIVTDDGNWEGSGETGETYLVATDGTMRSDARGFVEDPSTFLRESDEGGRSIPDERRSMEILGTTVLFQRVDREVIEQAAVDDAGVVESTGPLGTATVTAFRSLTLDGLDWVMVAEVGADELGRPIADFGRDLLVATALIVVVLTFVTVRWSDRLLGPVRRTAERLRRGNRGDGGFPGGEADIGVEKTRDGDIDTDRGPREFVALMADVETMSRRLSERRADEATRSSERIALLRQFLPRAVVGRAEAGEVDSLDEIPDATVVVLVLRGLGDLVRNAPGERIRAVLESLIDEIDVLADEHGIERMKLTGGAYYAVCGASRSFLDHVPRAVTFAVACEALVRGDADGEWSALSLSGGVSAGPVVLGLTGGDKMVYDGWGLTVSTAARLAEQAAEGQVLIDESVMSRLPPDGGPGGPGGPVSVADGRMTRTMPEDSR